MFISPPETGATQRTRSLDLRGVPQGHHESIVFERLDELRCDDVLELITDEDPRGLRGHIAAWWSADVSWAWTERGPVTWRARIAHR